MEELQDFMGATSALIVAAYALILVAAAAALWRLSVQWRRHDIAAGGRVRELLAVVLVAGVALVLVAYTHRYFQDQTDRQRLAAELQERDRLAQELRVRIAGEIDAVRQMLADRTVRSIERNTLTEARKELARFVALNDPRITQMLGLIDTELEIRALVALSLTETAPEQLARVYARLAELVPDNQEYRDKATQAATGKP